MKTESKKGCQVNGHKIKWSNVYEKWQVSKNGIVYEEFVLLTEAKDWAKNQHP